MAIIRAERSSIDLARFSWVSGISVDHRSLTAEGQSSFWNRVSRAGEFGCGIDEADRIAEGILGVEGALAPRSGGNSLIQIAAACMLGAREHGVEVIYCKIDVIRIRR